MLTFRQFLESLAKQKIDSLEEKLKDAPFVSPNDIMGPRSKYPAEGGFTFIYGINGKLYEGPRNWSHGGIAERTIEKDGLEWEDTVQGRCAAIEFQGEKIFAITIWDNAPNPVNLDLIDPCIKSVVSSIGKIQIPIVLFTKDGNKILKGEQKWHGQKTSSADMALLKKMHLMMGDEKKAAMKRMGLFSVRKRPDAEDVELRPEHNDNH